MNPELVWVTGAHGFIGRNVARVCEGAGHQVIGIGHGAWPALEARAWGISRWLNGDIASSNLGALRNLCGLPDVVVHLAGGSSVGSAIAQPREDFSRTVASTIELFEWLRQESPETRVVAVSTAAVYGDNHAGLISEDAVLKPYSPYGFHKLMMESICESYGASYGMRSIVARLFSVYGDDLKKQLLWDLCNKLLIDADRAVLGGSGDELRDWVAVDDVAHILSRLAALATSDVPKLNVGTGIGTTVRQVARHVLKAWHGSAAARSTLSFTGISRPGDPFSLIASPNKISKLGFSCNVSVDDGVSKYVAWFKRSHMALPNESP
jgi:UDP-glucose 4-epimerase